MRILLVEDEPDLAQWLMRSLGKQAGFTIEWSNDGLVAYKRLLIEEFDAIILDLGIPGMDGNTLLSRLRADDDRTPILILTARDSLADRVDTLESGADDFLPKPFMIEELVARLNALIRRSRGRDKPRLSCGNLHYDMGKQRFLLDEQVLQVTPRESEVLTVLIQKSEEPVNKKFILERLLAHDTNDEIGIESIEVIIHRLRKKLQQSTVQITTLRGIGYCLEPIPDDEI
ncbi:response regulator [Advenella sp. RU8]|uniref:response regulator n=1 Tax=Advenella sp. RU8 TaxID=3399575 RepID=UPI003AAAB0C8